MLVIKVGIGEESFDESTSTFVNSEYFTLELEHSLASLSKWESEFEKPFLGDGEKTPEESLYYIRDCMVQTKNPPEGIFDRLSENNFKQIQNYIDAKRTATWFNEPKNRPFGTRKIITSAVIYGWMVSLRIPFETKDWHLRELMTLIKVCSEQQKQPKKMGRNEAARHQAALNAQRKQQMGTSG